MKIIDALTLAITKRRAHRVRTATVTLVSSLLFIVLFLVAVVLQGLIDTSRGYGNVGWNEHFLTSTRIDAFGSGKFQNAYSSVKTELTAELQARKIKITDDVLASEEFNMELAQRANAKIIQISNDLNTEYEKSIAPFNPSAIFHQRDLFGVNPLANVIEKDPDIPLTEALKAAQKQDIIDRPPNQSESMTISTVEDAMIAEQLSKGQTLEWQPGQPYPLFVPYDVLLKLGNKTKGGKDSASVIAMYRELITQYQGKIIDNCYRNDAAISQVQQAAIYNQGLITAKDTKTAPIPLAPCQPVDQAAVKKAGLLDEQNLTTRPDGTKRLFPLEAAPKPVTQQLKFKIVGFLPYTSPSFSSAPSILDSVFYSVGMPPGQILPLTVPSSVVQKDAFLQSIFNDSKRPASPSLIVDFKDRAAQKAYLATSCKDEECMNNSKPMITTFGSMAVATESLADAATSGGLYAALVLSAIAGLIIMLSIGKVVADSSREIAVFRAIGARRFDIVQIYTTYGTMLAVSALLMAFLIALGVAIAISAEYADDLNMIFIRTLGAYESNITLWLVGLNWLWLGIIAGALLLTAIIGVLIPTINAVRGRLSNRMREE